MSDATSQPPARRWTRLAICVAVGLAIWIAPSPEGVADSGWRLLSIFAAVIAGFLLQPFAMGPVVLFGVIACIATGTLTTGEAMAGYGEPVVWLVVGAFLLAGAVRDTGLGRRIALTLVHWWGRSTLGLAYAQVAAELCLAPFVPSNTARGGGILAPISRSLSSALGSEPGGTAGRAGTFLTLVGAHANLITASMFLTGMAANPVLKDAGEKIFGVEFGLGRWALAMIVPGLLSLVLLPLFLHRLAPPLVRDASAARELARDQLRELGPWTRQELVMAAVFLLLLTLWSTKPLHGLGTTAVAWIGVTVLLLTGTQTWDRMKGDAATWDALIWLGGLLMLANQLLELEVIGWFTATVKEYLGDTPMLPTVLVLALVYFYSMYGFSMLTAHITAMAGAFLTVCHAAGAPPYLAIPLFACFSNLCACTTNYSTGPVILYFGLGYVPTRVWFRVGFLVSLFHLAVWLPVGLGWWKLLGWW